MKWESIEGGAWLFTEDKMHSLGRVTRVHGTYYFVAYPLLKAYGVSVTHVSGDARSLRKGKQAVEAVLKTLGGAE